MLDELGMRFYDATEIDSSCQFVSPTRCKAMVLLHPAVRGASEQVIYQSRIPPPQILDVPLGGNPTAGSHAIRRQGAGTSVPGRRSEERRVGKAWVSTWSSRG